MKRIYEFLVWDNCNNSCQFCWQREQPRIFDSQQRERILNEVLHFIKSDKFVKGSHILVCGGEVFAYWDDCSMLFSFFKEIADLMITGTIGYLYLNTNLIYPYTGSLCTVLNYLGDENLLHRVRFTTSYDIKGRFATEEIRERMLDNLKTVSSVYTDMPIVTNTILTKPACEAILSGEFNINKFMQDYRCWVNLIPYIVLDDALTADRSLIFKALNHVNKQCEGYLERYVPNMAIKQEKWLYMYKDGDFQFVSCELSPECGHSVNFKKYCKEGTCFCCDLENVFSEYA